MGSNCDTESLGMTGSTNTGIPYQNYKKRILGQIR